MPDTRAFRLSVLVLSISITSVISCSRPSPRDKVGYGTVMADVARRFELLGRAAAAGRFELADYELGEIEEQFQQALPRALPPKEGHPEVLPGIERTFLLTNVADLRRALRTRDRSQAGAAFERAATACNACHQASGHRFIEVPLGTGRSIPNTDPVQP